MIVAGGSEALLQAATANGSSIPVVMVAINYDPIARGYIKRLSHPGGNVTGVFLRQNEVTEKMVELLAQTFLERTKLALLCDRFSIDQLQPLTAGRGPRTLQCPRCSSKTRRTTSMRLCEQSRTKANLLVFFQHPPWKDELSLRPFARFHYGSGEEQTGGLPRIDCSVRVHRRS